MVEVEDALADEVQQLLTEQRLVLDAEFWKRERYNDGALLSALVKALPGCRDPESELLLLKWVNASVHHPTSRESAADQRSHLERMFGPRCHLCGTDESGSALHIDHVVPLARGGAPREISNLQLLCSDCNLGKSDLESRLLPRALKTNLSATPTPSVRFKRLSITGTTDEDGRTRGRCERCAGTSEDRPLEVVGPAPFAANLINSRVICLGGCT